MRSMLRRLDAAINQLTMYRLVLYGLMGLLATAVGLSFAGAIGVSGMGILVSTVALVIGCYVSNKALAGFLRVPYNTESWLITALILVFILPPAESLSRALLVLLCGVIAMASKYLIVWRGTHVLNPVAAGAFALSISGVLPATWWVATPNLTPFAILLGLVILRKQRNFTLFGVFAAAVAAMLVFNGSLQGLLLADILHSALVSWPIVFMGSIMLTEPITLPASKQNQLLFAGLVGVIFAAQLHLGPLSTTPQLALLVGNVFGLLFATPYGAMFRVKRVGNPAPDVLEIILDKPRQLRFRPGQYMEWTLPHAKTDLRGNRRTLSLASAPAENDVRLAVRTYQPSSSYKLALSQLQPGQYLRGANVGGQFVLPTRSQQPLLFIAGGIGITPFRSMIAQALAQNQLRDIVLVYIASSEEHFIYRDLFSEAERIGLRVEYALGRLTINILQQMVPDLVARQTYISGPDAMVTNYSSALRTAGLPKRRLHVDHFSGY